MSRIYETAIRIGAAITKSFAGDAKNAADAIKKVSEATKQLKAAEKAAASFKKLDDEVSRAKAKYDTASAALRRLEEAERAAGGATKESTKWRRAGERAVAASAKAFDRATQAQQKSAEVLRKLGVDTSKLASEQDRLTRALAATERQEKALTRYEAARERLFGARSKTPLVQKAGEQLRGVANDALLLGTAAGGAAAAMAGLVLKTLKAGDEIGDTADKLGIAATALQELRYGAAQSGAEVGALDKALAKMAVNIGKHKISKGKGAGAFAIPGFESLASANDNAAGAVDPFKQIGLKAKDLAALKPEEQLKKIADGLAKLKTHADQAAIAQEIFGKGVTDILPFLAEGSNGIDRLAKDAHKYGGVLSEEAIRNADLADKAMRDAEMAFAGLTTTLSADLLPVATKVFREFSEWVSSNRGEIKKWAETAAKWIETKGIPAFKNITTEITSFGGKVLWLVSGAAKLTGGFGNLAIVVSGLRLAPLAVTLGKIAYQGGKAALSLVRYAAASKAAKAAGMVGPGGFGPAAATAAGNAIGLAAKASLVLGAAAIGYEIGKALDDYFGLSDKLASGFGKLTGQDKLAKATEEAAAAKNKLELTRKTSDERYAQFAKNALIGSYEKSGLTHDQAVYAADHGGALPPSPRTGGRGHGAHVAPVIHIHDARTRDDVAKGMDRAKQQALDAYDRRAAHRKRVSFAG
jgi:hypothetical protein